MIPMIKHEKPHGSLFGRRYIQRVSKKDALSSSIVVNPIDDLINALVNLIHKWHKSMDEMQSDY